MNKRKFLSFRILGFLAMLAGLYIMVMSASNYISQCKKDSWIQTEAVVTDVSSRISSTGKHSSTVYDIDYKYEVNGETYCGEIRGTNSILLLGDTVKIKYDPNDLSDSTASLNVNISELLVPFVCGLIVFSMGVLFSGLLPWLKRRISNRESEDEFVPSVEEQTAFEKEPCKRPKSKRTVVVQTVILLMMLAFVGVVGISIFSQPDVAGTDSFFDIMSKNGYMAEDSTDTLREDWRIGSLLKKSRSVSDEELRIDFCVMDSNSSAKRLYDGMELPVTGGDEYTYTNLNYSLTVEENSTIYAVKIRNADTLIYAASSPEQKEVLIDLMRQIGYWKD